MLQVTTCLVRRCVSILCEFIYVLLKLFTLAKFDIKLHQNIVTYLSIKNVDILSSGIGDGHADSEERTTEIELGTVTPSGRLKSQE